MPKPIAGRRPTLKTIAKLSGLAQTTVSRALGDAPDISADTKKLVREIAAEIGYVPNRAGVRLRTGRTNVVALILPAEVDTVNMTSRLIAAIAGGLRGSHYHLIVVPELAGQTLLEPVSYVVETKSADAVIFNRIQPEDPRVLYLREKNFPFVTHGRSKWAADHAWFDYDNAAFGREAVRALAERGRTQLYLIAPPRDQNYGREMIRGAQQAALDCGVSLLVDPEITSDDDGSTIAHCVTEQARQGARDGIILPTPFAAMSAANALVKQGIKIGQDVDVFAKETFPILGMVHENIMCLQEDIQKAGQKLAEAALHEIKTEGRQPLQILDVPAPFTPAPPA